MEILIGLLGLGYFALPIVALIIALSGRSEQKTQRAQIHLLGDQLDNLREELARLRARLAGQQPPEAPDETAPQAAPRTAPKQAVPAQRSAEAPVPETPPAEPVAMGAAQEPPAAPAEAASARRRSSADLESAIGARWSVIVGGIAVALGAVFLVRYTIEAGLLGPGARIALGALFSAFLFAAGEWLRRRDQRFSIAAMPNADIPGILTGAGVVGAFATAYAAYAIYGFVGPGPAFILLTLVGLASLALSAVHGPKLAALGVVGAYATPLLVSSQQPNPLALAIHVLVVTASVIGVARLRGWLWLAFCGVAGGVGWTFMELTFGGSLAGLAGLLLLVGLAVIFVAGFAWQQADMPMPPEDRPVDRPAMVALGALAAVFFLQAAADGQLPLLPAGLGAGLVVLAGAGLWPALAPASIAAAVIVLSAIAATDLNDLIRPGLTTLDQIRQGLVPPDTAGFLRDTFALAVPAGAGAVWAAWRYGAGAPKAAGWLASAAGAIGFLALVIDYLRIAPFETRPVFGGAGLALAFVFAGLAERFIRLDPEDDRAPAPAAFAVAAVASLCFAIAVSLDAGWMPLAFALASLGIAWVFTWRPVAVLPWLCVAAAVIAGGSLWANLPFDPATIGTTPVFNKLILLTGLPAAAMIAAGEVLRRGGKDLQGGIVSAIGLAISGLFVSLEIRHWLNGGSIAAHRLGLAEAAAQTLAALAFTAGLQRIASLSRVSIYRHAATVASALGAALIAVTLLVVDNPLLADDPVGRRPFFNLLLPGYLLTGLAAAFVAMQSRGLRPRWFTLGYASLAGLLLFAFITLTVRHAFRGEYLGIYHGGTDGEFWTYSVVWLVTGAALLLFGLWLDSRPIRAASGIVIALTVCKVFLLDMAALSGFYRALSFIGLGLSLLAIGRLYQRLLARRGSAEPPASD